MQETKFGETTLAYFQQVYDKMEEDGYGKDDMLQEGFQKAVETNKMTLRVTETLQAYGDNEVWINEGVFYSISR